MAQINLLNTGQPQPLIYKKLQYPQNTVKGNMPVLICTLKSGKDAKFCVVFLIK